MGKDNDIKESSESLPEGTVFKHHEKVLCGSGAAGAAGLVKLRGVFAGAGGEGMHEPTEQSDRAEFTGIEPAAG